MKFIFVHEIALLSSVPNDSTVVAYKPLIVQLPMVEKVKTVLIYLCVQLAP